MPNKIDAKTPPVAAQYGSLGAMHPVESGARSSTKGSSSSLDAETRSAVEIARGKLHDHVFEQFRISLSYLLHCDNKASSDPSINHRPT
jgi:hypothetical protein